MRSCCWNTHVSMSWLFEIPFLCLQGHSTSDSRSMYAGTSSSIQATQRLDSLSGNQWMLCVGSMHALEKSTKNLCSCRHLQVAARMLCVILLVDIFVKRAFKHSDFCTLLVTKQCRQSTHWGVITVQNATLKMSWLFSCSFNTPRCSASWSIHLWK